MKPEGRLRSYLVDVPVSDRWTPEAARGLVGHEVPLKVLGVLVGAAAVTDAGLDEKGLWIEVEVRGLD